MSTPCPPSLGLEDYVPTNSLAAFRTEVLPRLKQTAESSLPAPLRGVWEADDLIDEALAKALASFDRKRAADPSHPTFFDLPVEMMRKYLRAAIIDVAVDLTRRLMQRKGPGGSLPSLAEDPLADHTSPSKRAERNEALARLSKVLAALPRDQYEAIFLHHLEGFSYVDVAAKMATTTAAVAGLIRRGLASLRVNLPERDFGSHDVA